MARCSRSRTPARSPRRLRQHPDDAGQLQRRQRAIPVAGLIADANGDLFGTTERAARTATARCSRSRIPARPPPGYASAPTTLVSFNGSDGAIPSGGLIADANGDLFGTTIEGGADGDGTVFEIVNTGTVAAPATPAPRPPWSASTAPTGRSLCRPDRRRQRRPVRHDWAAARMATARFRDHRRRLRYSGRLDLPTIRGLCRPDDDVGSAGRRLSRVTIGDGNAGATDTLDDHPSSGARRDCSTDGTVAETAWHRRRRRLYAVGNRGGDHQRTRRSRLYPQGGSARHILDDHVHAERLRSAGGAHGRRYCNDRDRQRQLAPSNSLTPVQLQRLDGAHPYAG